jgi:hypothetical protein
MEKLEKEFSSFFAHKKLKKTPSKVAQKNSNPLFFLIALSCPNGRRIHVPKKCDHDAKVFLDH